MPKDEYITESEEKMLLVCLAIAAVLVIDAAIRLSQLARML